MHLNEQLLITYECVSSIGTSLKLETMVEHFLKVFSRKTGSITSAYWQLNTQSQSYKAYCFYGKQSLLAILTPPSLEMENYTIIHDVANDKETLYISIAGDWFVFMFQAKQNNLEFIKSIIISFSTKLENAINACKNHSELMNINQHLEIRIQEEVEKNRQKDQHILQQSRMAQMGEMISMIAHQWRQPLGSISAVVAGMKLKILLNKFDLKTDEGRDAYRQFTQESLNKIEEYVRYLTNTIDDFRNFFKPDKHKESISLHKLVQRTLEIIGKALEINGIDVRIEVNSSKELIVYANELTQVILNILKNAEDAFKERVIESACITITISENNALQILTIEDNAGGIPEAILPHIFEPYFSTKQEKNGTGLGLYMSKIIIEEHCKGEIMAQNTALGAKFTLTLKEVIE